jgi:hypothetical protein
MFTSLDFLLAVTATIYPALEKAFAISFPIPVDAPVIHTTLLFI